MIAGNNYELDSWKCRKGWALTHISTNFIILNKINSFINHPIKRGKKSIDLKKFNINRFWECFLKNL